MDALYENANSGLLRIYVGGCRVSVQSGRGERIITEEEIDLRKLLHLNRFYVRKHIRVAKDSKVIPHSCTRMKSLNAMYHFVKSIPVEICQNKKRRGRKF